MLQIWRNVFFFTNEMEAKPPTHHKKAITSRKKVWTFDPVPKMYQTRLQVKRTSRLRLKRKLKSLWK